MTYLIIAIIAYLIGSVNFSIIISKKMAGVDVREKGSGNAGTTNVLRNVGKKAAAITLICDILKGVVTIIIALIIGKITSTNASLLCQIGALAVAIGHTFPIFFGFRGGKGVATSLINWKIGLVCLIFALALIALTKMVSLGSISAAILFAILTIFMTDGYIAKGNYIIFGILLALLVLYNHRENIKRITKGEENKISFSKKEENE